MSTVKASVRGQERNMHAIILDLTQWCLPYPNLTFYMPLSVIVSEVRLAHGNLAGSANQAAWRKTDTIVLSDSYPMGGRSDSLI